MAGLIPPEFVDEYLRLAEERLTRRLGLTLTPRRAPGVRGWLAYVHVMMRVKP